MLTEKDHPVEFARGGFLIDEARRFVGLIGDGILTLSGVATRFTGPEDDDTPGCPLDSIYEERSDDTIMA